MWGAEEETLCCTGGKTVVVKMYYCLVRWNNCLNGFDSERQRQSSRIWMHQPWPPSKTQQFNHIEGDTKWSEKVWGWEVNCYLKIQIGLFNSLPPERKLAKWGYIVGRSFWSKEMTGGEENGGYVQCKQTLWGLFNLPTMTTQEPCLTVLFKAICGTLYFPQAGPF